MAALNDYFNDNQTRTVDYMKAISSDLKIVTCTEKPCCYRCSVVLGLLGFKASTGTTKTTQGMGMTQWIVRHPLRDKIRDKYGDIATLMNNFGNVNQL